MNRIEFRYMVQTIEAYLGDVGRIFSLEVEGESVFADLEVNGARQTVSFSLEYIRSLIR